MTQPHDAAPSEGRGSYRNIDCPNCGRHRVLSGGICEKCSWDVDGGDYASITGRCPKTDSGAHEPRPGNNIMGPTFTECGACGIELAAAPPAAATTQYTTAQTFFDESEIYFSLPLTGKLEDATEFLSGFDAEVREAACAFAEAYASFRLEAAATTPAGTAPTLDIYEAIGRIMHESWAKTKRAQGWHGPDEPCSADIISVRLHCDDMRLQTGGRNAHRCDRCHADLTPWEQLPEKQKDINRHAFDAVLESGLLIPARASSPTEPAAEAPAPAPTGVCHCGMLMEGHPLDNHAPVEMEVPNRYHAEPNILSNNDVYPFCVHDDGPSHHYIIAFTVTRHTAESYAKQMNEVGYVETV